MNMNYVIYVLLNIWFFASICICFTSCLDRIGDMNVKIENGNLERRKKYRRINITKFKIYIPLSRKFGRTIKLYGKIYTPPFDGSVAFPTFILTIITYIIYLAIAIFFITAAIMFSKFLLRIAFGCALGYFASIIIITGIIGKLSN